MVTLPAAAAAYIHCQELLDSLVWTFENQVSEGAMRNNGRLNKEEVAKLESKGMCPTYTKNFFEEYFLVFNYDRVKHIYWY